jgi:lipopolysaccharide transport system permease protein
MALASASAEPRTSTEIVIEPSAPSSFRKLLEVWEYRDLLWLFVWRDVKVRYKQTVLGAAWAIIQPLTTAVIFSLSFGRVANLPSEGLPYPLFAIAGLVPWTYFSTAFTSGSTSVVGSQQLIGKIYFPRVIVPLASVITPLVDLAIAFVLLAGSMIWFRVAPGPEALWLPAFLLLAVATALAVSVWLAALTARYRDVRFVLPFIAQAWLFASPIAYPLSVVPRRWTLLFAANPMTGVIEGVRWSLLGAPPPAPLVTLVSAGTVILALVYGLRYFARVEGTFADRL